MTNISIRKYLLLCCCLFLTVACIDEEEYDDSPQGNFEALWRIMDEHYCFFTDKQIDWNAIYNKYQRQVEIGMSQGQLFEVLANMIGELKDGHVNLYTSFDVARNWSWHEDYPSNYSDTLITHYLGTDYKIASGLRYKTLDDNIG